MRSAAVSCGSGTSGQRWCDAKRKLPVDILFDWTQMSKLKSPELAQFCISWRQHLYSDAAMHLEIWSFPTWKFDHLHFENFAGAKAHSMGDAAVPQRSRQGFMYVHIIWWWHLTPSSISICYVSEHNNWVHRHYTSDQCMTERCWNVSWSTRLLLYV